MAIIDTQIKKLSRLDKTSKAGKPYVSIGIQVAEYGEQWANSFGNAENKTWKEGDTIKVDIFEEEYQGKKYLKFKMVELKDILLVRVQKLESQMEKIAPMYREWKAKDDKTTSDGNLTPNFGEDEINPKDIPF